MGNVSSRNDDTAPLFLSNQTRLSVTRIRITNARQQTVHEILPDSLPAARYIVKTDNDQEPIANYVQDPESSSTSPLNFLLRLNNDEDIFFHFNFVIQRDHTALTTKHNETSPSSATQINGLTFLSASTTSDLDKLITREFNANPNIHRHPNVDFVGDYTTSDKDTQTFEWAWRWKPPKPSEDKGGGWRNQCCFAEYNPRSHRFDVLVAFSFWVQNTLRLPRSPRLASPMLQVPQRLRLPSNTSFDSRISDSDPECRETRELPSNIETNAGIGLGLDVSLQNVPIKVDLNVRTGEELSAQDDGPLFRATMKALEQKTGNMRLRMKKVLKKAEAARETQNAHNLSTAAFMEALREASFSNANAVQPALEHYFEKIAKQMLIYQETHAKNLQSLIIDPLTKLYSNDIKQAEGKKKEFDDESREYYTYVSRYLGHRQDSLKEKKRVEADTKYQTKRRTYELKRFDYSSFMQDLHGGRKDQEVLSRLTKYAEVQTKGYLSTATKIEAMLPQLEALCHEVREADKEYQLARTGREEKRRTLEKPLKPYDVREAQSGSSNSPSNPSKNNRFSTVLDTDILGANNQHRAASDMEGEGNNPPSGTPLQSGVESMPAVSPNVTQNANRMSPAQSSRFKGIRDLEERDSFSSGTSAAGASYRKEGLIWSLSRPGSHLDPRGLNKQAWHKFWIVLDQGKLSEYINWKHTLEPHMDPIDLRMASVREARNADRRFCFEVITPNYTRVYQATGEDDMKSWIQSINNALQEAFEGKAAPHDVQASKQSGSIGRNLFGKSSSSQGLRSASYSQSPKSLSRYASTDDRPLVSRTRSADGRSARLLQTIREADDGNRWCADCNSDSKVEWVSINLGIIVCIECSGIHRSLGTHISKVRSLTLDTVSFTQDLIELLLRIGNRVSNMIFEANLDQTTKLPPHATRDQRLRFITLKYAERTYVQPFSPSTSKYPSPDECLIASIKTNDLQNILYALGTGANTNATDRSRSAAALYLALTAADPATTSIIAQSPFHNALDSTAARPSFPIAELLLQNGADIPSLPAPYPLSRAAQAYLQSKLLQKSGRAYAEVMSSVTSAPNDNTVARVAQMPLSGMLGSRLLKRNTSTGQASVRLVSRATAGPT